MARLLAALVVLLILGSSIDAQRRTTRGKNRLDKGDFKVGYSPKRASNDQPFGDMKAEEKNALQSYADGLNKNIALPRDIYLNADVCGQPNAFYKPAISEITICYEFIEEFRKHFRKEFSKEGDDPDAMVSNAITFVFYHEIGHCLIDVWDLPTTGREEDAVDQLAIVFVLRDKSISEELLIDAANFFSLAGTAQADDDLLFSDEHSFDHQRFYNMMCLTYGSNPDKYQWMIAPDQLPEERGRRCPAEYARANRSWQRLLEPYLKTTW
jgi:hypothetical protein